MARNEPTRRVLLVEDNAATRRMIDRHLRRSGYDVTAVESAESIVGRGTDYDIVVSDVHLPGQNGIELAAQLLAERPSQQIILITGDPDEALARHALSRGPVSYLLKPFELFELDSAMRQAAQRLEQREPEGLAEARASSGGGAGRRDGWVPEGWLEYLDAASYAGAGHSMRVGQLAVKLAESVPLALVQWSTDELTLAARCHELGRLVGASADPAELASHGAKLLQELGFPDGVVQVIRHLHERWDGGGGPDGLSAWDIPAASLILSVADSVDHYVGAWRQAGVPVSDAVDRAIGLVLVQQGTVFSPLLAAVVQREADFVRKVCESAEDARGGTDPDPPRFLPGF
jgi:response regulator RpfG family c-di-GMP phosphodiesterase